jgi:hypothetical protein
LALIRHPRLNNMDCCGGAGALCASLTILNATQSAQLVKNVNSTPENAGAKLPHAGDGAQFTSKLGLVLCDSAK